MSLFYPPVTRFDRFDKLIYRLSTSRDIPLVKGDFSRSAPLHNILVAAGLFFLFLIPLNKGEIKRGIFTNVL